jgi:hypothetical protein
VVEPVHGQPDPPEVGSLIKEAWIKYYREVPRVSRITISLDAAAKTGW